MSCTTVLVGKNASNDHSTMISRTDDGRFDVKKTIVVEPKDQPKKYKSVLSHVEVTLPDNPMRYTASPSVELDRGLWAETGINAANVGISATETLACNPRVLAADPFVEYKKAKSRREKEIPGGIGEEDIVTLVLPYVHTAREGVLRLASLLEEYGTYESNGVAFNDADEVWWMETLGGHHWIARRVPDDVVVINPNQFGIDAFDLDDAFGEQKAHLCSADLREFIRDHFLDLSQNGVFNPREAFGTHDDMDHIYNTPRAWFMGRYLATYSHSWDGENAEFKPESDNIPWCLVPDRKVTVEDVIYLLSGHFQGTDYDPYLSRDSGKRGMYRSIGINRTGVTSICQIRSGVPDEIRAVEWLSYGSTVFGAFVPLYPNVPRIPAYFSKIASDVSTENFYWPSRLLGALADPYYSDCIQIIDRYHEKMLVQGRRILLEYDAKMQESCDFALTAEANEEVAKMAKEVTTDALNQITHIASVKMKNGFKMSDH